MVNRKRNLVAGLGLLLVLLALPLTLLGATLKVGDKAPDFTLPDQNGKRVSLSSFLGKDNVVLAFYVLAFTGG
jgi:thioredoxin-dependent peroxiredoxin